MHLAGVAQMQGRMRPGEKIHLQWAGLGSHRRGSRKRGREIRDRIGKGLVPAHTKVSIPLKTLLQFVDAWKEIPNAPQIGESKFVCPTEKLPVRRFRRHCERSASCLLNGEISGEGIPTHRHRASADAAGVDRLVAAPDFQQRRAFQLREIESDERAGHRLWKSMAERHDHQRGEPASRLPRRQLGCLDIGDRKPSRCLGCQAV